ncbi:MAG: hypothetical protein Q8K75_09710 [Chlamydiales bacterium]|nr:hypothetical protein [Chlamydiales bacterium]
MPQAATPKLLMGKKQIDVAKTGAKEGVGHVTPKAGLNGKTGGLAKVALLQSYWEKRPRFPLLKQR